MINAFIGKTRFGTASAELHEGDVLVAKIYANSDGSKLRIVLPELKSFRQSRIDVESKYIEFRRKA
jgi:hypothetical protein